MPRQSRAATASAQDQPRPLAPEWAEHYPERWERELAALGTFGWVHELVRQPTGVVLRVEFPLPPDLVDAVRRQGDQLRSGNSGAHGPAVKQLRLEVLFPAQYPFFPPVVFDRDKALRLRRHENHHGVLCLVEDADWRVTTTVAELLSAQIPRLLRAAGSDAAPGPDLEVPRPEPVAVRLPGVTLADALLMPDPGPTSAAGEGALVVRYSVRAGGVLGTALVERLLGENMDIPGPAQRLHPAFPLVSYGRWTRDPDFDPADTPEATYQRLQGRLAPLHIDDPAMATQAADHPATEPGPTAVSPDVLETLCLLVPSEGGYRRRIEEWVAVQRLTDEEQTHYRFLPVQHPGGEGTAARTPETQLLAKRHVIIVGVGALGSHIATDVSRTGIGRLGLVDGDQVDVATASRQYAPIFAAGRPKSEALASHLIVSHPDTHFQVFDLSVGGLDMSKQQQAHRHELEQLLRAADLVIDASAAPAVTRYLAAIRQAHGLDFLHLSATPGAWGGCVFLATPATGCWACLEHHRRDHAVPVPPADPTGFITPPSCAHPSFTGTNPDLATIAHHASRVAIHRLLGAEGLGGDLYVSSLRRRNGSPRPVAWRTARVPVHPDCPLHAQAST